MKIKRIGVLLILQLILTAFSGTIFSLIAHGEELPEVFVGIDIGYGDVEEAKARIDQVSAYTNLVVIGSAAVSWDPSKLNSTFQYAYDKGLYFMSLSPLFRRVNRTAWFEYANSTWGNHLLGFYTYDEPAGRQLDLNESRFGDSTPSTPVEAASLFVSNLSSQLNTARSRFSFNWTNYLLFTSDYALYWFDYKAGYDAIFAEFGWNYSRQLNAALSRGAATVQNKDWGAIILWTYTTPPYIESGSELYKDLVLAYNNGAKYILIFDSNEDHTEGILKEEHLQALQRFWQYTRTNPRRNNAISDRVAYVLPNGFGYGFRGPNDKIWGLWQADALAQNISVSLGRLLEEYGTKLDIIYDDGLQPGNNYGYGKLIPWYSYNPLPSPSPPSESTSSSSVTSESTQLSPLPDSSDPPSASLNIPMDYVYAGTAGICLLILALAVATLYVMRGYAKEKSVCFVKRVVFLKLAKT